MANIVHIEEYLRNLCHLPVIDVRSPAEFSQAHIPGARSIPLFDDSERAVVGTKYKKENKESAVIAGLEFVGPKMAGFVREARKIAPGRKLSVYCWRGGMRSKAMAFVLETAGFEVNIIDGGYRSFRRLALEYFNKPWILQVIGGYTGSGKTEILRELSLRAKQVIDLEGLACHKGSAFGSIGMGMQPTTEQFGNFLFTELYLMNPLETIWVEDESHEIGKVGIPHDFFLLMQQSPFFKLEIPAAVRAEKLAREYGVGNDEELLLSLEKVSRRMGTERLKSAREAIECKDYYTAALISLGYYDSAYDHSIRRKAGRTMRVVSSPHTDAESNVALILGYFEEMI